MMFGLAAQLYFSAAQRLRAAFKNDEAGQGMIEYALLVALIAIVVVAALVLLGPTVAQQFTNIQSQL